ncbi:hypothetical protein ACKI2N_030155 [Cupriavidus sp. 30B13]|uniref:hypothetical protein n=1 Tax=Cupriavidus sp. 30B13 TaxID=3384241 RepID=UPI003B906DF3
MQPRAAGPIVRIVVTCGALAALCGCSKQDAPPAQSTPVSGVQFTTQDLRAVEKTSDAPAVTKAAPSQPAPPAPPPRPAPVVRTLLADSYYIATSDFQILRLSLSRAADIKIAVSIDPPVPIDMVVMPFKLTAANYTNLLINMGLDQMCPFLSMLANDRDKPDCSKTLSEQELFSMVSLSKKGVFAAYETRWVRLDAGEYSVVLDNGGNFTATRGDAPVQIAIYERSGGTE